jgi:hypothetical protein
MLHQELCLQASFPVPCTPSLVTPMPKPEITHCLKIMEKQSRVIDYVQLNFPVCGTHSLAMERINIIFKIF